MYLMTIVLMPLIALASMNKWDVGPNAKHKVDYSKDDL